MTRPIADAERHPYTAEVYGDFRTKGSYKLVIINKEEKGRLGFGRLKARHSLKDKLRSVPTAITPRFQGVSKPTGVVLDVQYGPRQNKTIGPFALPTKKESKPKKKK